MTIRKIDRDLVPKDPKPVRRFPARPGGDTSRQRVNDLVRVGFLDPSAAMPHLADQTTDRLPNKRTVREDHPLDRMRPRAGSRGGR
jgi:hypothetical protein